MILAQWFTLSIITSIIVGRLIRAGMVEEAQEIA